MTVSMTRGLATMPLSRNYRKRAALVLALVITAGLSACGGDRSVVDGLAVCGATSMQGWIGQPVGSIASRLPGVRILDSGSPTTYDFRPERLNVHVDSDGIVQGLSCG
jgi:hypothetical protein